MNIICTGNKEKKDFYKYLNIIITHISSFTDHSVFIDKYIYNSDMHTNINSKEIYDNKSLDLAVCIGGDGAFLSAVRRMKDQQLPILGIHIGNLGFLNTSTKNNYMDSINYILSNSENITCYEKSLISASFINSDNNNVKMFALNEIYINQSNVSRVLQLDVSVDDILLNNYKCDGLIIATPTGSTAYSLSAGGPIVHYNVNGYVITPVSPFSLSSRSIVINNNSFIKVLCNTDINDISIFSDGQESDKLFPQSVIKVSKSDISAKIVKVPTDKHYFERLRKQLGWSK